MRRFCLDGHARRDRAAADGSGNGDVITELGARVTSNRNRPIASRFPSGRYAFGFMRRAAGGVSVGGFSALSKRRIEFRNGHHNRAFDHRTRRSFRSAFLILRLLVART